MDTNRHIWEGWTAQNFIDELKPMFDPSQFKTKDDLKKWCKDNQPYYKKHIPEVYNYFKSLCKLLIICLFFASCKDEVIVHQQGCHEDEPTYTATFPDGSEMTDLHEAEVWHNISTGIWVYNDFQ